MTKNLKNSKLRQRSTLLVVALSTTLALGACTTDRHLGDGDPVTTPGVRTTPTTGVGGSESAPSNPPMMSSTGIAVRSAPRPMSAAEAAALLVDNLPPVRVLGPSSPDAATRGYVSEGLQTGQFVNPAIRTNPQLSVNSSISSQPVEAVTSGASGVAAVAGGVAPVIAGAPATTLTTLNSSTATVVGAAPVVTNAGAATGIAAPANGSGLAVGGNVGAVGVPTGTSVTTSTSGVTVATTAAANTTRRLVTTSSANTGAGGVRIVRSTDGRVVVTNADSN
jgi:hypothetical protein